jgi:hypothetical protein
MSRCGRRLWAVLFIGKKVMSQCTHLILWLECTCNATYLACVLNSILNLRYVWHASCACAVHWSAITIAAPRTSDSDRCILRRILFDPVLYDRCHECWRPCFPALVWALASSSALHRRKGAMPWSQETVVRYWCPLGHECGKENNHFLDVANKEVAEQVLAQHLRSQYFHRAAGRAEESIAEFVSLAHYVRFKQEVYYRSPPRSMRQVRASGGDASCRGRGRDIYRKPNTVIRSLSRSRCKRQRDMEYMSFQLQTIGPHGLSQATSTTEHKHSASGPLENDRIGGESGMLKLDNSAGSSIRSRSSEYKRKNAFLDGAAYQ